MLDLDREVRVDAAILRTGASKRDIGRDALHLELVLAVAQDAELPLSGLEKCKQLAMLA